MAGKKRNIHKKFLMGFILLAISVPMIQHLTQFANEKDLWGAVEIAEPVELTAESWFDGSFQEGNEKYLNESFGFRPDFVRIHNQLQFSLFSQPHANGVVIGKEWYLFELNYIKSYYGVDFIGDSLINERTRKLKFIQRKLEEQGKELIVLIAPGKGTFFPEFFPDSLKQKKSRTNYEAYLESFDYQEINYLDFNRWFLEMKSNSTYPLYAKGGIHWSKYGEMLAADSLVHFIEKISGKDLPDLVIDDYEVQSKNDHGDYDIAQGMNLIFQIPTYPMAYPKFHLEHPEKNTTKTLFVADSYYWGMYHYGFSQNLFGHGEFWFYNTEIYKNELISDGKVADIDIRKEVETNDVIVLVSTDANLYKFAYGFIDQLYEAYQ